MTELNTIVDIPLSALVLSPRNLRKTGKIDVTDLAASIRAHGLLQNLTVTAVFGADETTYAVEAGGRRLRALQQLAAEGAIASDWPVPCKVIGGDAAEEAGLTENVSRQDMHPADEFEAFSRLIEDRATVGEVAARFGKTERYVQQRMKLANVSPTILAEYRAGNATLEQLMALAITDDQKLQLRVWNAGKSIWHRDPDNLRATIVEGEFAADSQLGKFVGVAAYEKAGGKVRRDLFGKESDSYLVDSELVQRLAVEKLERTAEKIRKEGWAWVEARVKFDWNEKQKFGEAPRVRDGSKVKFADEVKHHAGVVVHLGYNGQAEIERGLIRPEDRKAAQAATKKEITGGAKARSERKPDDLSFASVQRLQAEAGQIVAAHLVRNPDTAIALLTAELAERAFYDSWDLSRTWVHISRVPSGRMPGNISRSVQSTPAAVDLGEEEKTWRAKLPKKRGEARAWILAQDAKTVRELLAYLVAREVDVVDLAPDTKQGVPDLAAAVNVNLAPSWKPTTAWLSEVPKRVVLAMLKEAGASAIDLGKLEKQPKAKFVAEALPLFPVGWLPKPLRASKAAAPKRPRKPRKAEEAPAPKADDTRFPWSTAQ